MKVKGCGKKSSAGWKYVEDDRSIWSLEDDRPTWPLDVIQCIEEGQQPQPPQSFQAIIAANTWVPSTKRAFM